MEIEKPGFIQDRKLRGEWAELRFMAKAAEYGLSVSKPYGDSQRYDVTVESKGRFLRVQVKSTLSRSGNDGFNCTLRGWGLPPYTIEELDFVAAYVIPTETWYIIPGEVSTLYKARIRLTPTSKRCKFQPYLEAWWLLQGHRAKPM